MFHRYVSYILFAAFTLLGTAGAFAADRIAEASSKRAANMREVRRLAMMQRYDTVSMQKRFLADTVRETRIVGIRESRTDDYRLELDLLEDQNNLAIGVYNLLGKKVLDVHSGYERSGRRLEYQFNTSGLPNGMYIGVVQGDKFRLAEKFIVSR